MKWKRCRRDEKFERGPGWRDREGNPETEEGGE